MMFCKTLRVHARTRTAAVLAAAAHTKTSAVASAQKLVLVVDQPLPQLGGVGVMRRFSSIGGDSSNIASAAASASSSSANGGIESLPVMVKIGVGGDPSFDLYKDLPKGFSSMSKLELLQFFARSDIYRIRLKDVDLGSCTVLVGTGNGDAPAPKALLLPLSGTKTIAQVVEELRVRGAVPAEAPKIFLRISDSKTLTLEALMSKDTTPEVVWAALAPNAQADVTLAREYRKKLSAVGALQELQADFPAARAQELGIQVLREHQQTGNMIVGMLNIPAIDERVAAQPKTFEGMAKSPQKLLLFPQRLKVAFELVDAVKERNPYGVQLSGPNGVGKSGIGLLAYLICTARSLPVVYIPATQDWVTAAAVKDGGANYFLQWFWRQNADLVVASPALRGVFQAVLLGEADPFTASVMAKLKVTLRFEEIHVALIFDETQHISKAVLAPAGAPGAPSDTEANRCAGDYFRDNWYIWSKDTNRFNMMKIASSHSEHDINLPDGEGHRLRFIEPLDPEDRAALQSHSDSPAYVKDAAAQKRVVSISGNILRKLVEGAQLLPRVGSPTKVDYANLRGKMWRPMAVDCLKWLRSLNVADRNIAKKLVNDLINGKVTWQRVNILYDSGIVYRTSDSMIVLPISETAIAIIYEALAVYMSDAHVQLSSLPEGAERGYELQRQVLAKVSTLTTDLDVPSLLLNGMPAPPLQLHHSNIVYFQEVNQVVLCDMPVCYLPNSGKFPCEAILMPAEDDPKGKIIFLECSVSHPLQASRVKKVLKWFEEPTGIASQLRKSTSREAIVVLCYSGDMEAKKGLSRAARALSHGTLLPPLPLVDGSSSPQSKVKVAVGDVTRVLDAPILRKSLDIKV